MTAIDRAISALEGDTGKKDAIKDGRKKRRLTPEGRQRLSEMMTKRWAERRKPLA